MICFQSDIFNILLAPKTALNRGFRRFFKQKNDDYTENKFASNQFFQSYLKHF